MRKILSLIAVFTAAISLQAQTYNVEDLLRADRRLAAGNEGHYRFEAPALTPSPKGYTPFYIGHYGRHGSRYSWTPNTYTVIKTVLDAADKAGALNEVGKKFYEEYNDFYMTPFINAGDLSALGWEQQHKIAEITVANFPEIFAKGGKVLARASTSQRAIVSMNGFTVGLQKAAPKVDITANSLHTNMIVCNPPGAPKEMQERYAGDFKIPGGESPADLRLRKYDYDEVLGHIFNSTEFLEEIGGKSNFVGTLYNFWAGYRNYCDDERFEHLFTPEQAVHGWEVDNYSNFISQSRDRYNNIPLLRDIINCAQEAIETGEYAAHFRFGHDTVLNAFVPLLNLNGCGYVPETADEVKYWFQNFNCPMASNVQFVLYRSKKNPEILFKVVWNGIEATIPQLEPVEGPYYRWTDFVAWAEKIYAEHPQVPVPQMPRWN